MGGRENSAAEIYENEIKNNFYDNEDYTELKKLMIRLFDKKYPGFLNISNTKKIDFVCWSLGKKNVKIAELII